MNALRAKWVLLLSGAVLLTACSTTRSLSDGQYRLAKNTIQVDDPSYRTKDLQPYIQQEANSSGIFGWNPFLGIYNLSGQNDKGFGGFLRSIGQAPVVYDPAQVDVTVERMLNHLEYTGYYGSKVRSEVRVHNREVQVIYHVRLGKRYTISSLDFDLPESEAFCADFEADRPRVSIRPGQYLSASALEDEADRSARYFRTKGYFGFSSNYYSFVADTLAVPGQAALTMTIRDYPRNASPAGAVPLRKYHIGDVRISYDDHLKIRTPVLEHLNTVLPGAVYDESDVNRTYSRLSTLNMFNGVNISMTPRPDYLVDCDIDLHHTRLQGFKLNLEASTNSAGLIGISPQLSYFHKNIFHGGERLNVGLKGNFQFKPREDVRSTEFTLSSGISFPRFVGLPDRLFPGSNIPRTDVTGAFNYQNRPEFTRTTLSVTYGYSGSVGDRFFFQFWPLQLGFVRIFDIDTQFREYTEKDPYLRSVYQSHFDGSLGGLLYYTTDNSLSPQGAYHYTRLGVDLAGNVLSLFNRFMQTDEFGTRLFWGTPYTQYVRTELQLGQTFDLNGNGFTWAFRLLGGVGVPYGNSTALPYEKAFYAGGANSMRGWQARTLGPGGSVTPSYFIIPNQTGDVKLEFDTELRFPLFWRLKGAVFGEVGNVWMLHDREDEPEISITSFPKTLAADWGIGIRLDFNIILVRLDLGMKVYDPALDVADGQHWIGPNRWFRSGNSALHFGVGYPF